MRPELVPPGVPVLIVRADAGGVTGSGHIVRSVALAEAWEAAGGKAIVGTNARPEAIPASVRDSGISLVPVPASHPDPADAAFVEQLIRLRRASWVCCDGYHFDTAYTRQMSAAGARVLVLDDIASAPAYDADVILNQNMFSERFSYSCVRPTRMLLGPRYALLRAEFTRWRPAAQLRTGSVERVLVTMGGTDPYDQAVGVVRALGSIGRALNVKVVIGRDNGQRSRVEAEARGAGLGAVEFVANPMSTAPHFAWGDLAISAGGSTCYELGCLGVPALLITMSSNQAGLTAGLAEAGAAIHLGWREQVTEKVIAGAVSTLCDDSARRAELSRSGRQLVDGQGAPRVVRVLRGEAEDEAFDVSDAR